MEGKYFVVVTLPKGDNNIIEIPKNRFYTSWDDAGNSFKSTVMYLTGKAAIIPKKPQPLSVESKSELIQIWICNTPISDPY